MKSFIENHELILMEGAIIERIRRSDRGALLHPVLVNAPLVYNEQGRQILTTLLQSYIDVAQEANLPFIMTTPTWRTNHARVIQTGIDPSINIDAAHFLQGLRDAQPHNTKRIKIGGMIGCKNDCYKPEEGLSSDEAEQFHAWQIDQLIQGGVDFIIAETLPGIEEAVGIAKALATSSIPYIISFVTSRTGCLLDGTSLQRAITRIDSSTTRPPLGYMINCTYPTFLCAADQPSVLFDRLIGCVANASSLDHCELDNATEIKTEPIAEWGEAMLDLNRNYGMKILGGCCGTNQEHLKYLVNH